jgi:hypothetical protein
MASTLTPTPKVTAAGGGATGATLLIIVAAQFDIDLPPEAAAAIVGLVAFLAGYLQPNRTP